MRQRLQHELKSFNKLNYYKLMVAMSDIWGDECDTDVFRFFRNRMGGKPSRHVLQTLRNIWRGLVKGVGLSEDFFSKVEYVDAEKILNSQLSHNDVIKFSSSISMDMSKSVVRSAVRDLLDKSVKAVHYKTFTFHVPESSAPNVSKALRLFKGVDDSDCLVKLCSYANHTYDPDIDADGWVESMLDNLNGMSDEWEFDASPKDFKYM